MKNRILLMVAAMASMLWLAQAAYATSATGGNSTNIIGGYRIHTLNLSGPSDKSESRSDAGVPNIQPVAADLVFDIFAQKRLDFTQGMPYI